MTEAGFVYKRDEQLMNAQRMVARAQEDMRSWNFQGVKLSIDLLERQLKFMQDHEQQDGCKHD